MNLKKFISITCLTTVLATGLGSIMLPVDTEAAPHRPPHRPPHHTMHRPPRPRFNPPPRYHNRQDAVITMISKASLLESL